MIFKWLLFYKHQPTLTSTYCWIHYPEFVIGKHMFDMSRISKLVLINNFSVLKKCCNKSDCLIHKMLIIQDLETTFSVQTDSISTALFMWDYKQMSIILVPIIYIHTVIKLSFLPWYWWQQYWSVGQLQFYYLCWQ